MLAEECLRRLPARAFWQRIIPVIQISVHKGHIVLGSPILPTIWTLSWQSSHTYYSTYSKKEEVVEDESSGMVSDPFSHLVIGKVKKVHIYFTKNPDYQKGFITLDDKDAFGYGQGDMFGNDQKRTDIEMNSMNKNNTKQKLWDFWTESKEYTALTVFECSYVKYHYECTVPGYEEVNILKG